MIPEDVEAARAEKAQIEEWFSNLNQAKAQEVDMIARAAFLNGYILAVEQEAERATGPLPA